MWTRKDFVALSLAAVGTFALTVATLLPRVVNATGEQAAVEVISPTLTVNGCTVQAQATGNADAPQTPGMRASSVPAAGQVYMTPDSPASFTLVVKNSSDVEHAIAFSASLDTSRPMGRVMGSQNRWKDSYNIVLKPGETQQIQVDTKVALSAGLQGSLSLHADDATGIMALAFNVVRPAPAPKAVAAADVATR